MPALTTPVCDFGVTAHDFSLLGTKPRSNKDNWTLTECKGERGLLVMFICNHCPFVKAILTKLIADCARLQDAGIGCVAISANDAENYPEDSFDNIRIVAEQHNFPFPYLYDSSQQVAKNYGAICTPDFFGYNKDMSLQYRGRFDASGRDQNTKSNHELYQAMLEIAKTGNGPKVQTPSIGCSIKWR